MPATMTEPLQAQFQEGRNREYIRKDKVLVRTEAFLKKHLIRFCPEINTFFVYEDGFYSDKSEEEIKAVIVREYPEFPNSVRNKVFENIKILTATRLSKFNEKALFNFENGIFDLEKRQLLKHTPEILSTVKIGYKFDPHAKAPRWELFFEQCFDNRNCQDIANLQEFAGYCLTQDTKFEKALFLIGGGANGKGVYCNTLINAIGKHNVSSATLPALADESRRAVIVNKLINLDTEVSKRAADFEAPFKAIVSGEGVDINEKYQKRFTYEPYCKLIFAANKLPRIDDTSEGFFRKIIVINFMKSFLGREDVNLKRYLLENELPGVFNWMIAGLDRLYKNGGFTNNENSTSFIKELKEESNPVSVFCNEMLVLDEKATISTNDLYSIYKDYCDKNGTKAFSKVKFGREIKEVFGGFVESKVSNSSRKWSGIRERTDLDEKFEGITQQKVEWEE